MKNTIELQKFVIDENASIDQNWQNLKAFEKSVLTIEVMAKPYLKRNYAALEAEEHARNFKAYEINVAARKLESKNTLEIRQEAYNTFVNFVKDKAGLFDIPEKYQDKAWSYAYQQGHGSGYNEVYNILLDVVAIFE